MIRRFDFICCGLLLLGLQGAVSPAMTEETADPVLATIAGEPIRRQDFLDYVKASPNLRSYMYVPGGQERLLNNMIMERLLIREGERLGIERPEGELADNPFAYAEKVKRQRLEPCTDPDEQALRAFHEQHPELFSTPLFLRLRRIGLPLTPETEPQVREQLEELRGRLEQGEIGFEAAVREYSRDPLTLDRRGDVGFIPIDEPERPFFRELRQAGSDAVIGPIEEQNDMLFLYQVTDRRDPILADFESGDVRRTYLARCRQRALDDLMTELESYWPVEIRPVEASSPPSSPD